MNRILFISSLYPSSVEPDEAPFNRQLLAALAKRAMVKVIAPVYWLPGVDLLRGRRLPPLREELDGIEVSHPRVVYTPGILVSKHWLFYKWSIEKHFRNAVAGFRPDCIIAGFAYPDGAAIASLCRGMGLPYSVRVNGSDFRVRTRQAAFRDIVMDTLCGAAAVFCPGQALKRDMIAAGVNERRIVAFNNGVNREVFRCHPCDGDDGGGRVVLFVGHLAHVKGPDRALGALARLRGSRVSGFRVQGSGEDIAPRLFLIGTGPMRSGLERLARRLGIAESVVFLGGRSHEEVAQWMNRAHCLCVPSRSEGMPNVVMEAMACGLPVVAADVGEIPYLVRDGENGFLVRGDDDVSGRLAVALRQALEKNWDRRGIASSAMACTWDEAAGRIAAC